MNDSTSASLISARGLAKRFGDLTGVDVIDFDFARGKAFGFLGPNGAGKTLKASGYPIQVVTDDILMAVRAMAAGIPHGV